MAKVKAKEVSKSGIFKKLFSANKDLLKVPSIAEVMRLFEAETGRPATIADRGVAANIKSKMRKEFGFRRGRRRKGGRPGGSPAGVGVAVVPRTTAAMLALEDSIEDCIYRARRMESESLADVIRQLRKARNQLIIMAGAK